MLSVGNVTHPIKLRTENVTDDLTNETTARSNGEEPEIYENENEGQLEENHISKVKKKRKNQLATTKVQS